MFKLIYQVASAFWVATIYAFAMVIKNRGECRLLLNSCNLLWGTCSWRTSSLCIQPTLKLYKLISGGLIRVHSIGILIIIRVQTSSALARCQVRINDCLQGTQIPDMFETILYWNHMISIKIPMVFIRPCQIMNKIEQSDFFGGRPGLYPVLNRWVKDQKQPVKLFVLQGCHGGIRGRHILFTKCY